MIDSDRLLPIHPLRPPVESISRAAGVIAKGGIVVYPTRCLYGIGGLARSEAAVRRIYEVKGRSAAKPLSILIPDRDGLGRWVRDIPEAAEILMDRFWPGQLTLVFGDAGALPPVLTAATGKIGIRLPQHPVAVALVRTLNEPITATSANRSGMPGARRIEDLPDEVADGVDLALDAGKLDACPGSTIVDVTEFPPRILREGVVPASAIRAVLGTDGEEHTFG
ncbi:MAG: L-threonylcarbamoyladenylate synthase [Desulfobacterales bacterium]